MKEKTKGVVTARDPGGGGQADLNTLYSEEKLPPISSHPGQRPLSPRRLNLRCLPPHLQCGVNESIFDWADRVNAEMQAWVGNDLRSVRRIESPEELEASTQEQINSGWAGLMGPGEQ